MAIVVAIDGPSGAGKSSTSRAVAQRARWSYLDTGALYRALTFASLSEGIEDVTRLLDFLAAHPISFSCNPDNPQTFLGKRDISSEIRSDEVTKNVSRLSAIPEVRSFLLAMQRAYIAEAANGIVVEGRDIGSVVAPEAQLKIYLTADLMARAQRREAELSGASTGVEAVGESLASRDHIDSTRSTSPLVTTPGAVIVDSTYLTLEETIERIWELLRGRNLLGLPIVAILGRPNVGKSTLINRFLKTQVSGVNNHSTWRRH